MLEADPLRAIADVARELEVSHGHLDRELTRVVGLTPRALARLLRMRRLLAGLDGAACFGLDVTDKPALTRAVEDAAPDILVNCAGVVHNGTILEATDAEFDFAVALNVRAQIHAIQAALPSTVEVTAGPARPADSTRMSLRSYAFTATLASRTRKLPPVRMTLSHPPVDFR